MLTTDNGVVCGGGTLQALGEHGGLFSLLVSARATCRFGPATHC